MSDTYKNIEKYIEKFQEDLAKVLSKEQLTQLFMYLYDNATVYLFTQILMQRLGINNNDIRHLFDTKYEAMCKPGDVQCDMKIESFTKATPTLAKTKKTNFDSYERDAFEDELSR